MTLPVTEVESIPKMNHREAMGLAERRPGVVGMSAMANGLVNGSPPVGPGGIFSLDDSAELEIPGQALLASGRR